MLSRHRSVVVAVVLALCGLPVSALAQGGGGGGGLTGPSHGTYDTFGCTPKEPVEFRPPEPIPPPDDGTSPLYIPLATGRSLGSGPGPDDTWHKRSCSSGNHTLGTSTCWCPAEVYSPDRCGGPFDHVSCPRADCAYDGVELVGCQPGYPYVTARLCITWSNTTAPTGQIYLGFVAVGVPLPRVDIQLPAPWGRGTQATGVAVQLAPNTSYDVQVTIAPAGLRAIPFNGEFQDGETERYRLTVGPSGTPNLLLEPEAGPQQACP